MRGVKQGQLYGQNQTCDYTNIFSLFNVVSYTVCNIHKFKQISNTHEFKFMLSSKISMKAPDHVGLGNT